MLAATASERLQIIGLRCWVEQRMHWTEKVDLEMYHMYQRRRLDIRTPSKPLFYRNSIVQVY